jgi:hypothetical protein
MKQRVRGREAPMIIGPRDMARLLRQLFAGFRRLTEGRSFAKR